MRRFKFKGEDGSCGYHTGRVYWGDIIPNSKGCIIFFPLNPYRIVVPYGSIEKFYENWKI